MRVKNVFRCYVLQAFYFYPTPRQRATVTVPRRSDFDSELWSLELDCDPFTNDELSIRDNGTR
jgi:hypothetical protein